MKIYRLEETRWCEACHCVLLTASVRVLDTVVGWGQHGVKMVKLEKSCCPHCSSDLLTVRYASIRSLMPHLPEFPNHGLKIDPSDEVKYVLGM